MVHDVIHERFPKHGPDYYKERDRRTRERLATLSEADPARFPLLDDLGVGLERLGRSEEAIVVLRDKLTRQRQSGLLGRDLYSSYANLGTLLIHNTFKRAMSGDASARQRFQEGIELIRKSVEVNPEAHFGRERWQAAIAEFFLAAASDSTLVKTFDCLGNRLDLPIKEILEREGNWTLTGYGRPADPAFVQGKVEDENPRFFGMHDMLDDRNYWPELSPIRRHITRVGAERLGECAGSLPSHASRIR